MTSLSWGTSAPKSVAVWNTAFLGDAVLTLPLLQIISHALNKFEQAQGVCPEARNSEAKLDFYVRPGAGSLFEALPGVRITEVPRKGFLRFFCQTVRPRQHDLWIGAHPSPRAAMAALLSGARVRVGYAGCGRFLGYNQLVPRRFTELDEIERLLQLLRPVQKGYPGFLPGDFDPDDSCAADHWPELMLPDKAVAFAKAFWDEHSLGKSPVLGVHPGSVWPTKRWHGFAEVARMASDWGAVILIFGGPGEEAMAAEMRAQAQFPESAQVYDLSGKLSVPELAACIKRLTAYVGNDSGPMHMAWAQGTPVTAIFGPTVRELGFFPRVKFSKSFEQAMVIETELPCRPCGLHGPVACPLGHHQCMKLIEPQRVWHSVRQQMEQNSSIQHEPE